MNKAMLDRLLIHDRPTCAIVTATRPLVDALIGLNRGNRNIRPTAVETYRRYMEEERWYMTNQGIGVTASGALLDAQHRLQAIAEAGYPPVQFVLVTGLSDDAFSAIDVGQSRSAADYLRLVHEGKPSNTITAAVRAVMISREDFNHRKFHNEEYGAVYMELGQIIDALLTIHNITRALPAAVIGALLVGHSAYPMEAMDFSTSLVTGEMLTRGHPALALRQFIQKSKKHGGGAATLRVRFNKTSQALRLFIDKRTVKRLIERPSSPAGARRRSKRQQPAAGATA